MSSDIHELYKDPIDSSCRSGAEPVKPAAVSGAEPKRRPPRPYFARLDPRKDLEKQIASRIAQYICAESDEDGRVVYMRMYHSLHGSRYRNVRGRDLWFEALKYLGRTVRRKHGLIWLDEKRVVPDLPPPYKPLPKLTPRKRRPRTAWYKNIAAQAEENGVSITEQIAADRTVSLRRLALSSRISRDE